MTTILFTPVRKPSVANDLKTSPFRQLLRHFITRFFRNDSFAAPGNVPSSLSQSLALVAGPGILTGILLMFKYIYLNTMASHLIPAESWCDRCFFVTYAMVVTGIVTTLQWDQLTLDRRDFLILTPLPVHPRTIFLASLLAQLAILFLFYLTANGPALLLFPMAMGMGRGQTPGDGIITAQLASTFAASALVFCTVITIRGLLPVLLGSRLFHRLASLLQAAFIAVFAMLMLMYSRLAGLLADPGMAPDNRFLWLVPSLWFTGLFETVQGSAHPLHAQMARTGLGCLLASMAGFALMTLLAFHRYARGLGAASFSPGEPVTPGGARFVHWLGGLVSQPARERASFQFVLLTAFRNRLPRLAITGAAALAFALTAARIALQPELPENIILSIPLLFSFCVLLALRYAAARPAEGSANWIFQLTAWPRHSLLWNGARKALVLTGVLPPALVFFPWTWLHTGFNRALAAHLLILILSLILLEILFLKFPKIPFTCPGIPGKANLKATWPLYWAGFYIFVYVPADLTVWLLDRPGWFSATLPAVTVAWLGLVRWRNRWLDRQPAFIFNEDPEPAVQQLNLG